MILEGIDPLNVEAKFTKSFSQNEENSYLKANNDALAYAGINKFPTVTLNSVKVKGSLNVLRD